MPTEPKPQPETPADELDDDFENEPLGDRQPEACTMEEGCKVCE